MNIIIHSFCYAVYMHMQLLFGYIAITVARITRLGPWFGLGVIVAVQYFSTVYSRCWVE